MTHEELETIKIALDNDLEIKDEAIRMLITHIKELEHEVEMLSASPDETSSHCGTFLEERFDNFCKRRASEERKE